MKKKDKSPRIPQRDKLDTPIFIREFPLTEKQKQFVAMARDKQTKMVFIKGPAGTAKTFMSVYVFLLLLKNKDVSDLLYTRATVESADYKLGFLPGEQEDKLAPYIAPFVEKLEELLDKPTIDLLVKQKRVQGVPINYVRGRNWNLKGVILDEAQNNSFKEILTLITRLGQRCKCFILADTQQSDLPQNKQGGFTEMFDLFSSDEDKDNGIFTFEFTEDDIMRSELVKYIVKKTKNR